MAKIHCGVSASYHQSPNLLHPIRGKEKRREHNWWLWMSNGYPMALSPSLGPADRILRIDLNFSICINYSSLQIQNASLTYQKRLIGKRVLSTNLLNSLSQVHAAEACHIGHQESFWPVCHSERSVPRTRNHIELEKHISWKGMICVYTNFKIWSS